MSETLAPLNIHYTKKLHIPWEKKGKKETGQSFLSQMVKKYFFILFFYKCGPL